MERHTLVFRGTVERNPESDPSATHFIKVDGTPAAIRKPKTPGLIFGFMEAPEGIVISHVDEHRLGATVKVDRDRHVGGGLGPNGKNIDDKRARAILDDIAKRNPGFTRTVEAKRGKLRQ